MALDEEIRAKLATMVRIAGVFLLTTVCVAIGVFVLSVLNNEVRAGHVHLGDFATVAIPLAGAVWVAQLQIRAASRETQRQIAAAAEQAKKEREADRIAALGPILHSVKEKVFRVFCQVDEHHRVLAHLAYKWTNERATFTPSDEQTFIGHWNALANVNHTVTHEEIMVLRFHHFPMSTWVERLGSGRHSERTRMYQAGSDLPAMVAEMLKEDFGTITIRHIHKMNHAIDRALQGEIYPPESEVADFY